MKLKIIIFFILFFSSTSSFAISCNHHCPECAYLFPKIKLSSEKLKAYYLKKEKEVAEYYNAQILPSLEIRAKLLKEIEKINLQIKMIEYQNSIVVKKIKHEIHNKKIIK